MSPRSFALKSALIGACACAVFGAALTGCAPLIAGTAIVGSTMVATDRRTAGTQVEDEGIERKAGRDIEGKIPSDFTHVNVTSYNRKVLLTGEVTTEAYRAEAERLARETRNVQSVVNEIVVDSPSGFGARTADTAITTKVRAALTTEKGVPSPAIKAVTERSAVYLMGLVTEAEGALAAKVVSQVGGVKRVVKLFDYLTPAELSALESRGEPAPAEPKKQ
jgi:osmotically-inducible protein OsmY